jgi:type I restriction enzyme S subunit
LPPLAEQRRVVARIEALAAQIHEARTLRHQAAKEAEVLIPRTTSSLLDDSGWSLSMLGEILAEKPRNGLGPQQEVESGGRPMLRINAVSSSPTRLVDMNAIKQVEVANDVAEQFVVQNDDVFIVRYNGDINRVAKPAIYKGANASRTVFPDKLIRLRPDSTKMTPDFLVFALNSRSVRTQIEELGKTTAGNIGVSGGDVKSFVVSVPPLAEQHRIVADLDALQAEVDALKRLQAETAAELDALLPSILDKVFKAEL